MDLNENPPSRTRAQRRADRRRERDLGRHALKLWRQRQGNPAAGRTADSQPPRSQARWLLAGLGSAALAAITGVISYNHGLDVVRLVGNTGTVAYLIPLVPDLMIATSSLTLIEASALGIRRPFMAMVALVAGIGWTVAVNIADGWRGGPGGALIAAGIPLAFVLTFESLLWLFRRGRGGPAVQPAPATSPQPQPAAASDGQAPWEWLDGQILALRARMSQRAVGEALGVSKSRVEAAERRAAEARAKVPALAGAPADPGGGLSLNGDGPGA